MDEDRTPSVPVWRTWLKRVGAVLGIVLLGLIVFHRPVLQTVVRRVAISVAAGQNLKLDLRVEGSVLGGIVLRNVHAVATGPSTVQSLDADFLRVDYSLWGFFTGGMSQLLQNVELRNATVLLDPAKSPPVIVPKKDQKFSLPGFFPNRLTLFDINLRMVSQPNDLIVDHLYLDLQPDRAGELRITKLQIPSGKSWADVTAQTSYENRNLFLRSLVLDDQTKLQVVNIDASKIGTNQLDLSFDGVVAGGKMSGSLALGEKKSALHTDVNFSVNDTSIDAVARYFGEANPGTKGDVRQLQIKGSGIPDSPQTWTGSVTGEINNLVAGGATFDHATIDAQAADGKAQIKNVELSRGANKISLQGSAELPASFSGFGHKPTTIQLRGNLPDLAAITAALPQPITGSAEVNGQIKVENDTVRADIALAGGPIDFGQGTAQKFVVKLNATKVMPPPNETRPYYEGLNSKVGFDLGDVRAKDYALDSVHGELQSAGAELTIEQLLVSRAANRLVLSGRYQLPADFDQAAQQPATVEFSLNAPNVGDFWATDSPDKISGHLQMSGRTNYQQQLGDGYFNVYATDLRARNLLVQELSAQGTTAGNVVYLNDLTARLNQKDYLAGNGQIEAKAPFQYRGRLAVNVADLSTFEPILKAAGKETKLGGALAINWEGSGLASKFQETGDLKLKLTNGRYGDLQKLEANIDANYSPQALNVPIIFFSSDKMMFQAVMQTHDQKLEVSKVEVDQGQAKYAGGYIAIPFLWENLGTDKPLFPPDGQVLISVQSENLDLAKLVKDFGANIPVAGLATVKLDAKGPLSNLQANFDLSLSGLRSEKFAGFKPAAFVIGARLANNQLVVNGKLEQARISPVTIDASLPLNLGKILGAKKFDEQTPVTAQVRMPRSEMNFIREFVPALERADGNMALNVDVHGTIAKPVVSGSGDIHINVARFTNPTLPAISNFNARLNFDGQTLSFPQFAGELAGGPFTLSGRITLPKLTEPNFDLHVKASAVLLARNDTLTARADADLSVSGPLAGAAVSGTVALTNSQFLKNLDLIPIGLPGRPAPAPEPPSASPDLTFPNPPLRDWKFDVAIKTKDPFLIRGNLANGGAIVDMKLTGTGLAPKLDGSVRLQNVEATLPFSRLEISQGFLYFNPDDPFNPGLDLQGTSLIKDYTVHVYVYGTANTPEAVFTSEPPLPQEEIITLLATGTTREELLSGGNVLAGRALMLLGQQLYHKIFKKGQSSSPNSVFDRLQVDVGNVDPRTGQQTATARYRVNEKIQLVGDIGVQGDFRGTIKYLIRFR
ncbi:MAG: translocation/assembly module TamB domain-containing protein [Chthoniobacterales bacterium]